MISVKLELVQANLGYCFSDITYLQHALTHPSFKNEQSDIEGDYQRLEFLGDAILGMLLAEFLFFLFPDAAEGDLSRSRAQMAGQGKLAQIARRMGFGEFIRFGRGEKLTSGYEKDSILSDVVESLIAAVYLDGGLDEARSLVMRMYDDFLNMPQEKSTIRDPKSELQETMSARGLPLPEYQLAEESGPPHARMFKFIVLINGEIVGEGMGRSKKIAQQCAATRALELLSSKKEP